MQQAYPHSSPYTTNIRGEKNTKNKKLPKKELGSQ